MATSSLSKLSGKRLLRNIGWNFLGTGAPLLVAIFSIPILMDGLGIEKFGILTLAWMVVGYFSLFDFGLGRALTKLVAEKLSLGKSKEVPVLIWTALTLMVVLGILGGLLLSVLSPWLVYEVLKIPIELHAETLSVFYLLSCSIPIVIISTGMIGVLEAHQRFGLVNSVRIFLGLITFLGPVLMLMYSSSLIMVVLVLVLARFISCCVYIFMCIQIEPELRHGVKFHQKLVKPLVSFGGWMTVTNIVGPLMVYMDRFLIGIVVTISAVAYYSTPYEIVSRFSVIPGAIMGVMFPAFSSALVKDKQNAIHLFRQVVSFIFILIFPIMLIVVTFANEGLSVWLGNEFAENSTFVLQVIAIGVLVNSLAKVPFGLIQSEGRPDITAKLHLMELPFYLCALYWLTREYGIEGAAVAWTLRVAIDSILLFIIANKLLDIDSPLTIKMFLVSSSALAMLVVGAMISGVALKIIFLLVMLPLFVVSVWLFVLSKKDKQLIIGFIGPLFFIVKYFNK